MPDIGVYLHPPTENSPHAISHRQKRLPVGEFPRRRNPVRSPGWDVSPRGSGVAGRHVRVAAPFCGHARHTRLSCGGNLEPRKSCRADARCSHGRWRPFQQPSTRRTLCTYDRVAPGPRRSCSRGGRRHASPGDGHRLACPRHCFHGHLLLRFSIRDPRCHLRPHRDEQD